MQADTLQAADTTTVTAMPATPFVTPQNGQYMQAAYLVAATVYLVYAISLFTRARAERR